MPYQGRQPGVGVRSRFIFTASGGQTLFSGADDNGKTLAYQDGAYVDVYLNGVMLVPSTDFTATTKTSVTLTSGATASDIVEIVAYDISSIADTVSKSQGGTFDNDITINGSLSVDGGTIKLDGNYPVGSRNVALGDIALDDATMTGGFNTAIGNGSMSNNTTGASNSALGDYSLVTNTTGSYNVALGASALLSNTTASYNTAVGYQAGYSNTTGFYVDALGYQSLYSNTTGNNIVGLGFQSLYSNTSGVSNVAVGTTALYSNTTASSNTALGYVALYSNQTGASNTAVGRSALYAATGGLNTAIGENAGGAITTGTKNTILGRYSGNQGGLDIRTASNNIVLSDGDGNPRVRVTSTGNIQVPQVYNNTTGSAANMFVTSGGEFARSTSSLRYKNTVNDATHGLTELLTLRSVTYKGNNDGDTVFGGLIAEEVHDAGLTEFVQYDDEGRPDALAYGNMVSLCIKAIQEQQTTIEALEARIAALEAN